MTTVVWRFVSRPEAAAPVLLDMNQGTDGNKIVLNFGRGFDISPPELKRSFAVNSLTDGGRLTSAAYDNRTLKFSVSLQGTLIEKTTNLALLKRELGKYRNLIMYTPKSGTVPPVFFRTFKSDSYVFVNRTEKGAWHVDCEVIAEPFAIGERIKALTNAPVSNNPANANGQRINLPTIIGDVPSPAFISIVFSPALGQGETFYLASRTRENSGFVHFYQGEAAGLPTGSFVWSGGNTSGGQAAATNFSNTASHAYRGTWTMSGTSLSARKGRYRVLARVHASVVPSTFTVSVADTRFVPGIHGKKITWLADDFTRWDVIDFGVYSHPASELPNEMGYSGEAPVIADHLGGTLDAGRVSGTGNFEWDYFIFLPADESMLMFSPTQPVTSVTFDGPNEMIYHMDGDLTDPFNTADPDRLKTEDWGIVPWRGAIPDVVPGEPNTWYMLNTRGDTTDTITLNMYYWPRWLEVAKP